MGNDSKRRGAAPQVVTFTRHPKGWWVKKRAGKTHYLTRIADDPAGTQALQEWAAIIGGNTRPSELQGLTLSTLLNGFLHFKTGQVEGGELSQRSWDEYKATSSRLIESWGRDRPVSDLRAADFADLRGRIAKRFGLHRTATEVQRVRTMFRWAYETELIEKPVRLGPAFKRPPQRAFRIAKTQSPKFYSAAAARELLHHAGDQLRAMLLLSWNGGYGNQDVALLTIPAVDLAAGWITWPRPKTGIARKTPLWPETIEAIRIVLAGRKEPRKPEFGNLLFLTKYRQRWTSWGIGHEFRKLTGKCPAVPKGATFYWGRHILATVGSESGDQLATGFLLGHATDTGIAGQYRERMEESRLRKVVNHVREWLFTPSETEAPDAADPAEGGAQ